MAKHQFLSPAWIAEVKKLRKAHAGKRAGGGSTMQVNYVVTGAPFCQGDLMVHADATADDVAIEAGHVATAPATLTLPYAIAKALLFEGDPMAAMRAFAAGELQVDGSLEQALRRPDEPPDRDALKLSAAIKKVTA